MHDALGLAFSLLAAWLAWRSLYALVAGLLSTSWPSARGRIVSKTVIKKRDSDDNEVWRPVVEYSYTVNGKTYGGTRIRFGIPNSLLWFPPDHPFLHQLDRDAHIDIRYSPLWPSVSAAQAGLSPFVLITIAAACGCGWFAYSLLTFAR